MGEYLTSNDPSPHLNMVDLSDAFLRIPTFICIYLYNSTLLSLNMKKKQNLTDGNVQAKWVGFMRCLPGTHSDVSAPNTDTKARQHHPSEGPKPKALCYYY